VALKYVGLFHANTYQHIPFLPTYHPLVNSCDATKSSDFLLFDGKLKKQQKLDNSN